MRDSSTSELPNVSCDERAGPRGSAAPGHVVRRRGHWSHARGVFVRVQAARRGAAHAPLGRRTQQRSPIIVLGIWRAVAQGVDLLRREQGRWLSGSPGERQAPALHGVGEQHGRAPRIRHRRRGTPLSSSRRSWPPRSPSTPGNSASATSAMLALARRARLACVADQPLARFGAGQPHQVLVLLVEHVVDAGAQCGTVRASEEAPAVGCRTWSPRHASRCRGTAPPFPAL